MGINEQVVSQTATTADIQLSSGYFAGGDLGGSHPGGGNIQLHKCQ